MGVKTAKHKANKAAEADLHESVAIKDPSAEPRPGGPDAGTLRTSDFSYREVPRTNGMRDARFQIVARQAVLDDIHAHGKTAMESEVCGVLVGDVYCDIMAPWAYVEHSIRGESAVGKQTQVTITSETWTRIHEALDRDFPGKKIIGWYHTHPGFGIFLSGMDLFIQENFFNQAWQVASVYDPHSEEEGVFVWRDGKATRESFLVEPTVHASIFASAPAPAVSEPQSMLASTPVTAKIEPTLAESEQIAALTRRVRSLERKVDLMLTGALFVVLVALVAPLIVYLMRPDTVNKLPSVRGALQHLTAEPDKRAPAGKNGDLAAPSILRATTRPSSDSPTPGGKSHLP